MKKRWSLRPLDKLGPEKRQKLAFLELLQETKHDQINSIQYTNICCLTGFFVDDTPPDVDKEAKEAVDKVMETKEPVQKTYWGESSKTARCGNTYQKLTLEKTHLTHQQGGRLSLGENVTKDVRSDILNFPIFQFKA